MSEPTPNLRFLRRLAFAGQLVGWFLALGLGLTSGASGLPYVIAGMCVLVLSFLLWLYCQRSGRSG